ncbi:MAG: ECF transporter S component [Coprobacillus sp.]
MNAKKLTYMGLLLAVGIVLPQVFHFAGPQSGAIFLPMHIPVLIAGFVLGPIYGLALGLLLPLVSSVLTGMPAIIRLPFMIGELMAYGYFSGLIYKLTKGKSWSCILSLLSAMILGRIVYGLMLMIATYLLNMNVGGLAAVMVAISTGIPGIIIQLILIPLLVYALERKGVIHE